LPADSLLASLPRLDLDPAQATRFLNGQTIPLEAAEGSCRVYRREAELLGVGEARSGAGLHPVRLLATGKLPVASG
jgi:hypothetical protein